jgi:cell division protein FtsN
MDANGFNFIRRADLGAAGTYYRALVGPFASAEKAAKLCNGLKAAGGDCVILKTDVSRFGTEQI